MKGKMPRPPLIIGIMVLTFFPQIIHPSNLLLDSRAIGAFHPDSDRQSESDLKTILSKCADYCDKLSKASLLYICKENIDEQVWSYPIVIDLGKRATLFSHQYDRLEKYSYLIDYQLIKMGNTFEEKRTFLKGNKKRIKPRFQADKPVFGPVGLLGKYWQQFHRYRIIKKDSLNGTETLVLEVVPLTNNRDNPNFGKVWIGLKNFVILKIDYYQESLVDFAFYKNEASYFGAMPDLAVTTTFGIESHGLRFPSRTVFSENYIGGDLKNRLKRSSMVIDYEDYRFFTVDVEVKY